MSVCLRDWDECRADRKEVEAVRAALRNYELNGKNAAGQVEGLYSDLEETTTKMRAFSARVARLEGALALYRKMDDHGCACDSCGEARKALAEGGGA